MHRCSCIDEVNRGSRCSRRRQGITVVCESFGLKFSGINDLATFLSHLLSRKFTSVAKVKGFFVLKISRCPATQCPDAKKNSTPRATATPKWGQTLTSSSHCQTQNEDASRPTMKNNLKHPHMQRHRGSKAQRQRMLKRSSWLSKELRRSNRPYLPPTPTSTLSV